MPSFNKVILIGHLTRDPELKYTNGQTAVVNIGLAVNHKFRTKGGEDREEVCFVDCTGFGKTAEFINQYFTKGAAILVEGRLKYESWEDKNGGGKRSKHVVLIDQVKFVGEGRRQNKPNEAQSEPQEQFRDEEIPF